MISSKKITEMIIEHKFIDAEFINRPNRFLTRVKVGSEIIDSHLPDPGRLKELLIPGAKVLLKYENGSNAVINYFSNGSKKYNKERVEVYSQERTWIMDNYRKTEAFGLKGFKTLKTKMDKGHKNQFHELIQRTQNGGEPLIPINEIFNVTKATFAAIESMETRKWIKV